MAEESKVSEWKYLPEHDFSGEQKNYRHLYYENGDGLFIELDYNHDPDSLKTQIKVILTDSPEIVGFDVDYSYRKISRSPWRWLPKNYYLGLNEMDPMQILLMVYPVIDLLKAHFNENYPDES